ncbi:MAG: hypothetical protein ABI533_03485 [Betaproteobacteria bacterium]
MVNSIGLLGVRPTRFCAAKAFVAPIIGKTRYKSQNFPVVMIFRRSLVRELTATAVALFLVLLAILFVNLVLRLLANAAGGIIATDGILRCWDSTRFFTSISCCRSRSFSPYCSRFRAGIAIAR